MAKQNNAPKVTKVPDFRNKEGKLIKLKPSDFPKETAGKVAYCAYQQEKWKDKAAHYQAMADPARRHVHQQPREAVLGPLGQALVEPLLELGSVVAEQAGQRRADGVADRQVGAAAAGAEDHRGALAIERARAISGISERRPRRDEREQQHEV